MSGPIPDAFDELFAATAQRPDPPHLAAAESTYTTARTDLDALVAHVALMLAQSDTLDVLAQVRRQLDGRSHESMTLGLAVAVIEMARTR